MGRPVQGAGCLGGGFLSEQYLQRHFFPCCVGPSPARWPGCYISTLSSGHPASRASSPSLAGAVVLPWLTEPSVPSGEGRGGRFMGLEPPRKLLSPGPETAHIQGFL